MFRKVSKRSIHFRLKLWKEVCIVWPKIAFSNFDLMDSIYTVIRLTFNLDDRQPWMRR